MILLLRTDSSVAELYMYDVANQIAATEWEAHRTLSDTILKKIEELLSSQNKTWSDIKALAVFRGPGSYTGLRIGISAVNALAYSLRVPIVATDSENWIEHAIQRLDNSEDDKLVEPNYGGEAHITKPRK